MEKYSDDDQYF